jgi:hypothetical protein
MINYLLNLKTLAMKKKLIKFAIVAFLAAIGSDLFAQKDTVYTLDPATLIPSETGYYVLGASKVVDGSTVTYNGCVDAYGDGNFAEDSTQQGFTYQNCMLMPTCIAKGTPTVPTGFIGLGKSKYLGTDSAHLCYIESPQLSNLDSIYMQTSSDVSVNSNRTIPYLIEYSRDNGVSWSEDYWIKDVVATQGGYTVTYKYGGNGSTDINAMVDSSKVGNIRLRVSSVDVSSGGQRVFVHNIKIYAKTVIETTTGITSVTSADNTSFTISGNTITAEKGVLTVYNVLGVTVGSGSSVSVSGSGVYIVKTANGKTKKIFILN